MSTNDVQSPQRPKLSLPDRWKRWRYLQDVELWLDPLPGKRRREVIKDLRTNLADAAADVGMARAIEDLGKPRELAREYVQAEPRKRPAWSAGVLAAGASLLVVEIALMAYCAGMIDALQSTGGGVGEGSFFGIRIQVEATDSALGATFTSWSWPLTVMTIVVLLIGARAWRVLRRTA